MRLAIPTLILAVILVLGWRVCSGGESDHLRLTEEDLPIELRQGYRADAEPTQSGDAGNEPLASRAGEAVSEVSDGARESIADTADRSEAEAAAPTLAAAGETAKRVARDTSTDLAKPAKDPQIRVPALPPVSATESAARQATPVKRTATPATPSRPTSAAVPVAPPTSDRLYVVKPGDWLHQIAREQYGDATRARDIARANALSNPNALKPGQELVLP